MATTGEEARKVKFDTGINVDAGHGSDVIRGSVDINETLKGNDGDDLITCQQGNTTVFGDAFACTNRTLPSASKTFTPLVWKL